MRSRALDSNNDIFAERAAIAWVGDGAEVVQHVRSRLLFYAGECVWDITAGVPYFQRIFQKPADLAEAEMLLKTEVIRTLGVLELTDFGLEYNRNTRQLRVTWAANTTYGSVVGATVNINVRTV